MLIVHKDSEILLVLYTGQRDVACPVYRTARYCLSCLQDREMLLVLHKCIQDRDIFHNACPPFVLYI